MFDFNWGDMKIDGGMHWGIPLIDAKYTIEEILERFNITDNEGTHHDTLAFNLQGLSELSFIDTVKMRAEFGSSIPSDFMTQILLYDSKKQIVLDSLLPNPVLIAGSLNSSMVTSPPQYLIITNDRIKRLKQADKLIVRLSLTPIEEGVPFNETDSLRIKLGASIKTANHF